RGVVDGFGDHLVDRQVDVLDLAQVEVEDFAAAVVRREPDAQLTVEAAWPQQRRVEYRHEGSGGNGQDWRLLGLAFAHTEIAQELVLPTVFREWGPLVQQPVQPAARAGPHHPA